MVDGLSIGDLVFCIGLVVLVIWFYEIYDIVKLVWNVGGYCWYGCYDIW